MMRSITNQILVVLVALSNISEISAYVSQDYTVSTHKISNFEIYVLRNFFNGTIAEELVSYMKTTSDWMYTSNHDVKNANKKYRSNEDVRSRRAIVTQQNEKGLFAYSKYELTPQHHFTNYVESLLLQDSVKNTIASIVNMKLVSITDMFVSRFTQGDFLSLHNDGAAGSLAIAVNLSKDWAEEQGGVLEFTCSPTQTSKSAPVCLRIAPEFNSVVLFRTRPKSLPHRVTEVLSDSERLAITGWYLSEDDAFSDYDMEQLILSKG